MLQILMLFTARTVKSVGYIETSLVSMFCYKIYEDHQHHFSRQSGSVGLLLQHIKNSNSEQKTNAGLHFYCLISESFYYFYTIKDGQHLYRSKSCKNEGNKLV